MTTVEWILVTEIMVLVLLVVLLAWLTLRGRKKASTALHNNNIWNNGRTPVNMPGQMQAPYQGGYNSGYMTPPPQAPAGAIPYYGQTAYGVYTQPGPGRNMYGQPEASLNACEQTVYGQTAYRQGNYAGYPPAAGLDGNSMYRGWANYNTLMNGDGYGYRTPGSEYIPSPMIGEEKTILVRNEMSDPADRQNNQEELHRKTRRSRNARTAGKEGASNIEGGRSTRASHTPTRWRVDFMEMSSGRQVSRDFRNELVVGRQMPAPMESGRLYLSMDATVSRAQFCLYATEQGLMIENLSNVNVTRKNGYPLWQPVPLEEGDILEMGRMRYMVKGIHPAA